MIRAIWYITQLVVVTLATVWLLNQKGTIVIQWLGYTVTVHVGLVIFSVLFLLFLVLLLHNIWIGFVTFPAKLKRYKKERNNKKGHEATMRAFVALAAGDIKHANYLAYRAGAFLSGEGAEQQAVPLLLQAHTARLQGREKDEKEIYKKLFDNKETSLLGLQGLTRSLVEQGDYEQALTLARESEKTKGTQSWVLKLLYDLEIRTKNWKAAQDTLKKAMRRGVVSKEQADSDLKALLIHLSDLDIQDGYRKDAFSHLIKAYKIDPVFVPTVLRLVPLYLEKGKRRTAISVIEKAWKAAPHPELVSLWFSVAPDNKPTDPLVRLRWFEKLLKLNPDSAEARIAVAKIAIEDGLWGEARHYLMEAQQKKPSARIYRLLAELEDLSTHDDEAAREWIEKASEAPADKCWVCKVTGHLYENWSAIAEPHGSFNTIIWDYPDHMFESTKMATASLLGPYSLPLLSEF